MRVHSSSPQLPLEPKTPKDPGGRTGLASSFLRGVGPHGRAPGKGKWKKHPPDREAVTATGGGRGCHSSRRSVAPAAFPSSPFFPKGTWGPPVVSDSWPCTTAVAPHPQGLLPSRAGGSDSSQPHPPISGDGTSQLTASLSATRPPASCHPCPTG